MRKLRALAGATVALILTQLAVRLIPFRLLAPSIAGLDTVPSEPIDPEPRALSVGRAISHVAERLPWHSTCLVRALATRLVLAVLGIPSILCLGVIKEGGAIRAHAWLLVGGAIVCGGREAPEYTPIAATRIGRLT